MFTAHSGRLPLGDILSSVIGAWINRRVVGDCMVVCVRCVCYVCVCVRACVCVCVCVCLCVCWGLCVCVCVCACV